jgi:L-fucose mutarotase
MLKQIDRAITAELLHALMSMGHGDVIVVCDVNHPAATIARHTTHGRLIDLGGCTIPQAVKAILTLMPIDTFVDEPIQRMQVVGDPSKTYPLFSEVRALAEAAEGRPVGMGALERFAFYEAAKKSFAIVRTADPGPYGCFIIRKGVI